MLVCECINFDEKFLYWSGVFVMVFCIFIFVVFEFMLVSLFMLIVYFLDVMEGMVG